MDEPWIIIPSDSVPGALVADAFRAAGLNVPRASVLTHSIPLRNSLLAGGRFLTVFANSMLHFSAHHLPVKILPVELPIKSRPVEIITLKNRTQSPLVHLFTECATEVAKSINANAQSSPKVIDATPWQSSEHREANFAPLQGSFRWNVRSWHFCDMPGRTANVRYWGLMGLNADMALGPLMTQGGSRMA